MKRPRLSADPDASMMYGQFRELRTAPLDLVLGLDPGGKATGWCLYSPSVTPRFGTFAMVGDLGAMLSGFYGWLYDMIERNQPAILAIERPFGRGAFTADAPAIVLGVAHMAAFDCGIGRREFTASQIKKAMTGRGNAKKPEVISAIREQHGLAVASDHEADAAGCAILAWSREAQKC